VFHGAIVDLPECWIHSAVQPDSNRRRGACPPGTAIRQSRHERQGSGHRGTGSQAAKKTAMKPARNRSEAILIASFHPVQPAPLDSRRYAHRAPRAFPASRLSPCYHIRRSGAAPVHQSGRSHLERSRQWLHRRATDYPEMGNKVRIRVMGLSQALSVTCQPSGQTRRR
jgi:hypothetical protein